MGVNRSKLRKTVASFARGSGKVFHKFHNKVNRLRILPMEHRMNRFDVSRQEAKDEEVGEVFTIAELSCQEVFVGKAYRVCLPTDFQCRFREMAWEAYHEHKAAGGKGKKPAIPREVHYINAIDLDEPEKGVQQMRITPQLWEGINKERQHCFYGIKDLLYGYEPEEKEEKGEKKGLLSGGGGFLRPLKAFGEDLFQMDIHVKFAPLTMDSTAFAVDVTAEGGPVDILSAKESENIPARFYKEAKDLFLLPKYYPGYSSDEDFQDDCDVLDFIEFCKTGKDPKSGSIPSEEIEDEDRDTEQTDRETEIQENEPAEEPEEEESTTTAEPAKKKRTYRRRKIKKGDVVEYVDPDDKKVYRGSAEKIAGDILTMFCTPEEQLTDEETSEIQSEWDTHKENGSEGNPVFKVALADCKLVHLDA